MCAWNCFIKYELSVCQEKYTLKLGWPNRDYSNKNSQEL